MTEKQARDKGYIFTGIYERDKEEVKSRKKDLEFENYRTVLVVVPDSKYSRGPKGTGYSLYVETKYFTDARIKDLFFQLEEIQDRKEEAKVEHQEKLRKIEQDAVDYREELEKLMTIKQTKKEA